MLDGNPRTAWVFNKLFSYTPASGDVYNHGLRKTLRISTDDDRSVTIDGIGIINGYAKSQAIYRRNNRIREIKVSCGKDTTTLALKDMLSLQRFKLPRTDTAWIRIEIAAARQPSSNTLLLSAKHHFYLYDLAKGEYLYHREFTGSLSRSGMGWIDANNALLAFDPTFDDYQHRCWYRLTVSPRITFTPTAHQPEYKPAFLPGVNGPNYGA